MAAFKGRMLTAEELVRYKRKSQKCFHVKGEKIFAPTGSWLEGKQVQTLLDQTKGLLEIERAERVGSLSQAEWDENMGVARVTKCAGRQFEKFGYQENSILYLNPEEALFLLESNRLDLCRGGVSMSLQQAYNTLLSSKTNFSLLEYRVFSHFLKHGFKLLRHSPKRTITAYERQIGLNPMVERRIKNAKNSKKGIATKGITCSSEGKQENKASESNSDNLNVADQKRIRKENDVVSDSSESSESDIEVLSELCRAQREVEVTSVIESSSSEDSDCQVVYSGSGDSLRSTVKVKRGIELINLDDSNSESRLSEIKEEEVSGIKIESSECKVAEGAANVTSVPCDINLLMRTEELTCSGVKVTGESSGDISIQQSSFSSRGGIIEVEVSGSVEIRASGSLCLKDSEQRDDGLVEISKVSDISNNNSVQQMNPHILNDVVHSCDTRHMYQDVSQPSVRVEEESVIECKGQSLESSQQDSSVNLEKRTIESGEKLPHSIPDDCSLVPRDCTVGSVIQEPFTMDIKSEIKHEGNSDIKSELPLVYETDERNNDFTCIENLNVGNNCEIETSNERLGRPALESGNSSETLNAEAKVKEMMTMKTDKIEIVDLDDENSKEVEEEEYENDNDNDNDKDDMIVEGGGDEPHVVYVGNKAAVKEDRNAILESFPDCAGRRIIFCKAPSKYLLPPNVSPTREEYKIVLRRLVDPGIGGRPERYSKNARGSRNFSSRWSNEMRNNQWHSYGTRQRNGRIRARASHCNYFQERHGDRPENSFINLQNQQPRSERMDGGPWMNFSPGRRDTERNPWTNFPPEQVERENNGPWMNYFPGTGERHQNNAAWRNMPLNRDQDNPPWSNLPPERVGGEYPSSWALQREQNPPPWANLSPERGLNAPPRAAFSQERGQNTPPWVGFPPGRDQNATQRNDFSERREREQSSPSWTRFPPETLNRNQNSPSWISFPPEGTDGDGRPVFSLPNRSPEWGRYPQNSYRRPRGPRRRGSPRRRGGRYDHRLSHGSSFNSQDENNDVQQNFDVNSVLTDQNDRVFPNDSPGQYRGNGRNVRGAHASPSPHDVSQDHASQDCDGQQNALHGARGQRSGRKRMGGRGSRSPRRGRGSSAKCPRRSGSLLRAASDLGERVRRYLERAKAATDRPTSSESSSGETASDVQSCSSSSCETESSSDENEAEDSLGKRGEHITPLVKLEDYGDIGAVMKSLQVIPTAKLEIRKPLPAKKLQIKFDLYLPTTVFRKSEPPVPDYRVVIMRPQDDIPSSQAIALLQHGFEDDVPLLFVLSSLDSVNIFMYSDVELPLVAGNERLF